MYCEQQVFRLGALDDSTGLKAQYEHKLIFHNYIRHFDLPTTLIRACFAAFTHSSAFQHCYRAFDNRYDTHAHIGDIGTLIYVFPFQAYGWYFHPWTLLHRTGRLGMRTDI